MSKVRYPETISFRTSTEIREMIEKKAIAKHLTVSQYLQGLIEMAFDVKGWEEKTKAVKEAEYWDVDKRINELEKSGRDPELLRKLKIARKYLHP